MKEGLADIVPELKEEAGEEIPRVDAVSKRIRMDANIEKVIRALFESVENRLVSLFPETTLRRWAKGMVGGVNRVSRKNTVKTAQKVQLEVEPLLHDKGLSPFYENIVDENVGLIRSIPLERLPLFKNKLVSMITGDRPQSDIREMIQDEFVKSKNKARLIARDQVGKLNGKLNQYRQRQIGGERYVWHTSDDERVRKDHDRLDGKTFYWDRPPVVDRRTGRRGHPGDDFQCRCWAEMVVEDVVA